MSDLNKALDREIVKILIMIQNQSYWHKAWLYAQTFGEKTVRTESNQPNQKSFQPKSMTSWNFFAKLCPKDFEINITEEYHLPGYRLRILWENELVFSASEASLKQENQLLMVNCDKLFVKVASNYIYHEKVIDAKNQLGLISSVDLIQKGRWIEVEYYNPGDWEQVFIESERYFEYFECEAKRKRDELRKFRHDELDQENFAIIKKLNINTSNL